MGATAGNTRSASGAKLGSATATSLCAGCVRLRPTLMLVSLAD